MSHEKTPVKQALLPFQKENVAGNQTAVPLPYLRGTRLVAVRWISSAINHTTQPAPKAAKK